MNCAISWIFQGYCVVAIGCVCVPAYGISISHEQYQFQYFIYTLCYNINGNVVDDM